MAVQYEKKPSAVIDESAKVTAKIEQVQTLISAVDIDPPDLSQDPVFLAVLTGAVTKHGVEHYSLANEGSIKGRVQALLTATEKIKGVLSNHA